jgi:hypothetical protein
VRQISDWIFCAKPPIPHESASHAKGYEHASSFAGTALCHS